ncbi:A-kinase anchor protein 7 isoform gamma [Elysia marginata]|uniref:A-kinase anchor protein 7 isoform gamma n=1 Tax=Elysia marginata TaxID=1093978 RepID=A0AAV4EQY6_9GAST|nr:A-kinase anchor protein 7 isoform gamma [Elysia marginata]
MRPKSTNSLVNPAAKYYLPVTLQNKIKAKVSENPNYFIQQILTGANCYTRLPFLPGLKMAQADTNKSGCPEELKSKEEEEKSHGSETNTLSAPKSANKIHSTAKEVQEKVLEASEVDISSTRIEPATFHITLMVMHLEDEAAVKRAEETLEKIGPILASKFGDTDVTVEFKGLSVFGGGRVVFTPPQPSAGLDSLKSIAEEAAMVMKENGIHSTDRENKVFHPHLTLFKFKDDKHLFKQGIRKIKESLYAPFKEEHFGFQKISSIQLCQMGEKREDGYYAVNKEITWGRKELS